MSIVIVRVSIVEGSLLDVWLIQLGIASLLMRGIVDERAWLFMVPPRDLS